MNLKGIIKHPYLRAVSYIQIDLKAISQNVMHSSVTITDDTYGNLVGHDVHEAIPRLGQGNPDDLQSKIDEPLELLSKT
jgi:hypothetical protein